MEIKKHFNTFSEAIREGAKLRPQTIGTYFDSIGRSCALGAALEACFGYEEDDVVGLTEMFPYILNVAPCPVNGCFLRDQTIVDVIVAHLNDDHLWTREQIADWLESEEEKLGYVLLTDEPDGAIQAREVCAV